MEDITARIIVWLFVCVLGLLLVGMSVVAQVYMYSEVMRDVFSEKVEIKHDTRAKSE